MLTSLKSFIQSFSFRSGVLIFITLCIILTILRVHFYRESINTAYSNVREIIEAHVEDINLYIEDDDPEGAAEIIKSLLNSPNDRHIYVAIRQNGIITGNLDRGIFNRPLKSGWQEITIAGSGAKPDLDLLLEKITYPDNSILLIGHDLEFISVLRQTLLPVLVTNILLSLVISLLLSTGIVWLINRKLRQVNLTAEAIIMGNLKDRVPVNQVYDQFDKLGLNINRMLDWISKLLDMAKYASNALAHDMRTPLSRHRIELQALSENSRVPDEIKRDIKLAVSSVDNLAEMFNNITSIAKAESGEGAEFFKIFDLTATIKDIVELYEYEFEQNGQKLLTDIPPQTVEILGDKQLISQATVNLLDNAGKYALQGATISVSLKIDKTRRGTEILIVVADNGPGIPAELREKVLQRFYRIEHSRHTEGTGLGLSLVNAIAGLHRGEFYLEDNFPGLKAVMRLPKI